MPTPPATVNAPCIVESFVNTSEVPVASPMLGVTKEGLVLNTTLPVPVETVTPVPP